MHGPRDAGVWAKLIAATGATLFAAVPGVYRQMLKQGDHRAPGRRRLRHGLVAGEALPPALLADWQAATGLALYEAFGMSECSTFVSNRPGLADPARQPRQAAGRPAHRGTSRRRRHRPAAARRDRAARRSTAPTPA